MWLILWFVKHELSAILHNFTCHFKSVAEISESLGRLSVLEEQNSNLRLRRINRIRNIQDSLAIEGNTLSEDKITAILEAKPVIAPLCEVQEARNAIKAYERFDGSQVKGWQATNKNDLLKRCWNCAK